MKKRILFSGESSWLSTGFSTFNREILNRLNALGKYELAEYGAYGAADSAEAKALPWRFYGALPANQMEQQVYQGSAQNQFGAYKFDAVVADFQPDIVIDFRDPWMFSHIMNSRFRPSYKTILAPTVDSHPQKREWLDMFKKSDVILAYSRYGQKVMKDGGVNVFGVSSPGVDLNVFKPLDKKAIRSDWGVQDKVYIIGTVMRNQKRKLFPEIFAAFADLRKKYPDDKIIKHSVLLCHTSWPDMGWDIPELLERYRIMRDAIFTYKCDSCKRNFLSWFIPSDAKGMGCCVFCGQPTAHMPNTHHGISTEELAEVYNLMDVYVQSAICEGWGIPIVEAKGCGVPGIYQNYSAMEDHVQNGGGLELKVGRMYTESETMADRSLPDRDDMVSKLHKLLTDHKLREKLGKEARDCAVRLHDWDMTAKTIEAAIDSLVLLDRKTTWDARLKYKPVSNVRFPPELDGPNFVLACYRHILGREPDAPGFSHWISQLESGRQKDDILNYFRNEIDSHNRFEEIRFKKSLKLRGINPDAGLALKTNLLPGIMID